MSGPPRILLLGAAGQLGQQLQREFADAGEVSSPGCDTVDLVAPDALRSQIRDLQPDVILNAAAYTAVDRAESEPAVAMAVNSTAPAILAEEALRSGGLLVHYSTDYVFDGTKQGAWTEDDAPHPLNVYGASKLAGEDAIRHVGGKHLIFRTSWVYGPHGHNFLLTMLHRGGAGEQLSIVDDQVGAPTSVIEVARATRKIVDGVLAGQFGPGDEWAGLYQMTCGGSVSWYGFAQAIFRRAQGLLQGKNPTVRPISSSGYPSPARRPRNSVLSNEKLCTRFGLRLPPWESALDEVMREVAATNETFRKLPL